MTAALFLLVLGTIITQGLAWSGPIHFGPDMDLLVRLTTSLWLGAASLASAFMIVLGATKP